LHLTTQKMARSVQEQIDRVADYASEIVLGYGLCSNGIAGVTARQQGLIVPRCHDCIAFFLGSCDAYREAMKTRPGTYYLTPGLIEKRKDPLSIIEEEYTSRVGWDMAVWAMKEELKHYTHIVFINTGAKAQGPLRKRALVNASFLKKTYEEIQGSLNYFKKLIHGPHLDKDFFFITPGEEITQEMFLADAIKCEARLSKGE